MASIKTSYKLKDSNFDVNLLSRYSLYLQTHLNDLNIAIFDTEHHKCILFEHYDFGSTSMDITLLECLEAIWNSHQLLSAGIWHKVVFIGVNQDFVFIPSEHYSEDSAPFYLALNSKADLAQNHAYAYEHGHLNVVDYFPVNKDVNRWLSDKYPNITVKHIHFNSAFLEGMMYGRESLGTQLQLVIHPDMLTIACVDGKSLKFLNTFSYGGPADLLYFTLFVMGELGLSASETAVTVWGTVSDLQEGISLLTQYVGSVALGTRPKVSFASALDELPDHHAFDLFSAYLAI